MKRNNSIYGGVVLISLGLLFLFAQIFSINIDDLWPLILVVGGGAFLVGAFSGQPGLAVPGAVLTGLGLLLYFQSVTGRWESWAYAWTLIPGFVGAGLWLNGRLAATPALAAQGRRLISISILLLLVFGTLLGGWFSLGQWWPLLLIAAGAWLLIRQRL